MAIAAGMPKSGTTADTVLAIPGGQHGEQHAGLERARREGQPLDLLPQEPGPGPVSHGERDERGGQERDEHGAEPVEGADQHGQLPRRAERVGEGRRDPARSGNRHQARSEDQADRGQRGRRDACRRDRPPAPGGQFSGREQQEHEHEDEHDDGETALRERAHLLGGR